MRNSSSFGLLCVVALSIGQLCTMSGYYTQSFIVDPVLHSVRDRKMGSINEHSGYYGSLICMVTHIVANLAAPLIWGRIGSKMSLVVGSSFVTLYMLSFMYIHFISYYLAAALMGVGFACNIALWQFRLPHRAFFSPNNSKEFDARLVHFVMLTYKYFPFSIILGGIVMRVSIKPPSGTAFNVSNVGAINGAMPYRYAMEFSISEIRCLYASFAVICFTATLIFAVIPTRAVVNSLAVMNKGSDCRGIVGQMLQFGGTIIDKRTIMLTPVFALVGSTTFFWITVYPTTLIFTKKLSNYFYLPACYSIVLGCGEIIMGLILTGLSKRISSFARISLVIGALTYMCAMILVLLSTPPLSTTTGQNNQSLLLEPSAGISLLVAFLFGMADNCMNTSRFILCAASMPDQNIQVFSISMFWQSLTVLILVLLSHWMSFSMYFAIFTMNLLCAILFAGRVNGSMCRMKQTGRFTRRRCSVTVEEESSKY